MGNTLQQAREPYAPYRFSVDDFYRMADASILTEDDRVELIDGQILVKGPPGPEHAAHVFLLNRLFVQLVGDRAFVRPQDPLHVDELNDPQPDLNLVRPREDLYMHAHPRPADVLLAIEIAFSSAPADRKIKAPLYARAGIPEFWLVDIPNQKLEVYREPGTAGYRYFRRLSRKARVTPTAFPDLDIAVADILRPV